MQQTGYLVEAKDGKEYGPLDRDTVQRWYFEGRLDQNSKVWEPGKDKLRLKEVFDLDIWHNPSLIVRATEAATGEPGFEPKMMSALAGDEDREPTPGMFAAGILLIINGVLGFLVIGLILTGQLSGLGQPRGYIVPIIDLIVATGLIRGKEKYRKWGLVRAVLGGVFFVLGAVATLFSINAPSSNVSEIPLGAVSGWIELFFQLLFCAGIAALLWGDWPSKKRVWIGVAAVMAAWSGIFTTSLVTGLIAGLKEKTQIAKYSVAGGNFSDDRLGVSARLPEGWALLEKDNPVVKVPGAAMIAMHQSSGCFAALLVERVSLDDESPEAYLSLVLQNRLTSSPNIKDIGRRDVVFGGFPARRLDTSWSHDGNKFRGFSTACKGGLNFYMLTGWCAEESAAEAILAFQSLEKVFDIGSVSIGGPPDIQSESEEDSIDLVFFIQEQKRQPDGAQTLLARGTHAGTAVGFELSLGPAWQPGSLVPGRLGANYTGTVRYRSAGPDSDAFVQALDQIYETEQSPKHMKPATTFSAVSLAGDPRDLTAGPVKLKLFFETSDEQQYAEFYTNIDLTAHKIYISEKDPEYRAAIIRALRVR